MVVRIERELSPVVGPTQGTVSVEGDKIFFVTAGGNMNGERIEIKTIQDIPAGINALQRKFILEELNKKSQQITSQGG